MSPYVVGQRFVSEVTDHLDPEEVAHAEEAMERIEKAISGAAMRLDSPRLIRLGREPSES